MPLEDIHNDEVRRRETEVEEFLRRKVTVRRVEKALKDLLKYAGPDEEKDFYNADHTATISEHIYGSIVVLQQFLGWR